ncbi:MAG: hypothetical protein M1597_00540 [Candidatus Thermoplasmatota archaeon]|nr:hypothetical protein [Candidatus Thermoplasmatota archaeon]
MEITEDLLAFETVVNLVIRLNGHFGFIAEYFVCFGDNEKKITGHLSILGFEINPYSIDVTKK